VSFNHVRRSPYAVFALVFLAGATIGGALVATTRGTSAAPPASPAPKRLVEPSAAAQPTLTRASAAPPAEVVAPIASALHEVATSPVSRALTPPAPRQGGFRGSVSISSQPQGADVFMNGQRVGTTPLVLQNLDVGSRALRLTLDGHETWSRAVQVVANERATVVARLQRSTR
jgi:PEGA domain-containing protein